MRKSIFLCTLLSLCLYGSSCAARRFGSVLTDVNNRTLEKLKRSDWRQEYDAIQVRNSDDKEAVIQKSAARNAIMLRFLSVLDASYYHRERTIFRSRAGFEIGSDVVSLGLSGVASIANGARVKSVLSAASTGFTGARTSIDKNVFYQKSQNTIVSKMRALRAEIKARMEESMNTKSYISYPLEKRLLDLQDYYYAGTLEGALQSIETDAGKQMHDAKEAQHTAGTKKLEVEIKN